MTHYILQRLDSDNFSTFDLRDATTAEVATPDGPVTVSGPSAQHTMMRATAHLIGAHAPLGGFALVPAGRPGPSQWRALQAAAEALVEKPTDPERVEALRAALQAAGPSSPVAAAPPAPLSSVSAELLRLAEELAQALVRESLWKDALDYCRALATFDTTSAEAPLKAWAGARAKAIRLLTLVGQTRAAAKAAKKTS